MSVATRPATDVDLALERLRLLLRRRIMWLRAWWGGDPLQGAGTLVVSDARADVLARGRDVEAELAFHREHEPAAALSEEIASLGAALEALDAGPLDALAARFGLQAFDRELLVLALAPQVDPSFGRLFAYVADDASARHATPRLAFDLFGDSAARRARLAPEAPLRRLRLVVLDERGGGWCERPLRMEERVLDHLRGSAAPDPRVADLLRAVDDPPPLGGAAEVAERLTALLADASAWPLVELHGPARAGARSVAGAVADGLGLGLAAVADEAVERVRERPEVGVLIEREAALLGLVLLLEGPARALAGRLAAPQIVVGEAPDAGGVTRLPVTLEPPDAATQRALWTARLATADDATIGPLVEQFDLGPGQIASAVAGAAGRAALRGELTGAPALADLWAACREQARFQADGLARPVVAAARWDALVLPDAALEQLDELAAQASHRTRVYEDWGFAERLARGRGITALFAGASGTGKTMAAEALATRLDVDLYRIDLAGVVSKWIGETEKNLRAVFDAAEDSGAILFFDEADALFGKRTDVKDAHDRYANIEVDYLLQRMEDYRGIAILATNRRTLIDPAFMRRLRFVVDFPFPEPESRERLWAGAFPPEAPLDSLDVAALARMELAGGSIRTIALNAAFLAAHRGEPIGMAHVMHAARREYAKLERLLEPAQLGIWA